MRKNLIVVSLVALFVSFAAVSFAEVGFQFRVPFQATANKSDLKDVSGISTLLTFDIDPGTTVGVLNEQEAFTDGSTAGLKGTFNVTAVRFSKKVAEPIYVGLDLGNISGSVVGKPMADVFGGVNLLSSKGKVVSYLNVELLYRFAKTTSTLAGSTLDDFGGTQLSFGAGINF